MTHLTHEQLASFLGGALNPMDTADVETHLDSCEECRQLASLVVRQRAGAGAAASATTDVVPIGFALPANVGEVVDGRYRIDRVLGVGGMGAVFEAHQMLLNQRVALKLMLPQLAQDQAAVGRFLREARAASRLHSPSVCRVLDLGTLPSGTPFLVMEFLSGESLEARLAREGRMSDLLAARHILPVLNALEEAHSIGITHRDIKPANLFLTRLPSGEETVKILDFGIAKSGHPDIEAGLESTSARTVMGSPQYMAPEQLVPGNQVDGRTDIWSLGCVLYELVTAHRPFEEENLVDLMYAIQRKPHKPPRQWAPQVSDAFEAVINKCLSKAPAARFDSVNELREALKNPQAVLVAGTAPGAPAVEPKRVLPFFAMGGALLALLTIALIVLWSLRSTPPVPLVVAPVPVAPKVAVIPSPPPSVIDAGVPPEPTEPAGTIVATQGTVPKPVPPPVKRAVPTPGSPSKAAAGHDLLEDRH